MAASPSLSAPRDSLAALQPWHLLAAAVAVGLGLRLLLIGSKSLWLDETTSLHFAQATSTRILTGPGEGVHPPLFYLLLHYWLALGESETSLRLFSALVGTLTIPLTYAMANQVMGRSVAVAAAWLAALSPLLVWYAQELRSYSLLTMLGLVTALAVAHLATHPAWRWWLLFVAAMTAALYTHYNAPLLVPVHLVLLLLAPAPAPVRQRALWVWLAAWPFIGLLYWPWLTSAGATAFIDMLVGDGLVQAQYLAARLGIATSNATYLIAATLVLSSALALCAILLLQQRGPEFWQGLRASAWLRSTLILFFVLATLFIVVPRGYMIKRLVVVLWPYVLIVVAWVFPWDRQSRRGLAVLLGASLVATLINITLIPKDQWRELVTALAARSQAGDVVWIQPAWEIAPFDYYLSDTVQLAVSSPPTDAAKRAAALQQERIWHVYQTYAYLRSPDHTIEHLLESQMEAVESLDFYRVHATLYQRRPPDSAEVPVVE